MSCELGTGAYIEKITIYTDGAARGNPGESASGYMVRNSDGIVVYQHSKYNGIATNNYAEYMAILLALRWCAANFDEPSNLSIALYSDNELAIRQLNRQYKIKSAPLKALNEQVNVVAKNFRAVVFKNVRREDENISAVDMALNRLLDERRKYTQAAEKHK